MRLIKILETVNQIEKSSFLKIIDNMSSELRKENEEINEIFCHHEEQIRNIDDGNIIKLFKHTRSGFKEIIEDKLKYNDFHFSIMIDILIRDGNSIMSREWLSKLYNDEILNLKNKLKTFLPQLEDDNNSIDFNRKRDYNIFRECVKTAFENDESANREKNISRDEKSVLNTLSNEMDMSVEEVRMIFYSIVPLEKYDIDNIINCLKEIGVIFYHRKTTTIYIPDEIIWLLREITGVELSDKFFRRVLRQLPDSMLNRVSKRHNIDIKTVREEKIKLLLKHGMSPKNVLLKGIFKDNATKIEKKTFLGDLIQKKLSLNIKKIGTTAEDRANIIINYFNQLEKDENIGISLDGYSKLLNDLHNLFPEFNTQVKSEFELQQEFVLKFDLLSSYNIKPLDLLDLLSKNEIVKLCDYTKSKTRGNIRLNILDSYKDIENLYLENYDLISRRDLAGLKEKGIEIKESEIGLKFEELTKIIFRELKYTVDEKLRKQIQTKRSQIDILINLGNKELIIIECKTNKNGEYHKY